MMSGRAHAFTLIELLIVVAIIGILAAIAIPNFLQAQVRAKVARALADMRGVAVPMETYYSDENAYPPDPSFYYYELPPTPEIPLYRLSTPVDYISTIPTNPFPDATFEYNFPGRPVQYRYFAQYWKALLQLGNPTWPQTPREWALVTSGPDQISSLGEYLIFGEEVLNSIAGAYPLWAPGAVYDPTNGTVSNGDIIRVGP